MRYRTESGLRNEVSKQRVVGAARHLLEAPLTGGTPGAKARMLTFIVGGDAAVFERCRPLLASVGLVNTLSGLILPFAVSALGTFLVRQALLSVPDAQIEAARIDGASELYIVYRLLAPLLKPTLISLFLFSFVAHWNDYFWPLVLTTDEHARTLPLAIALLREQGTGRA